MKPKKIILIFVVIGVGLIFWGLFLPAETGPTLNKNARCRLVLMMRLKTEMENYKYKFGSYPTGDDTQVLKKLFGDDPQIEFFRIDPWGTHFVIKFPSTNSFVISSAGKDKTFGDADDIIFNSVSNDFVKP